MSYDLRPAYVLPGRRRRGRRGLLRQQRDVGFLSSMCARGGDHRRAHGGTGAVRMAAPAPRRPTVSSTPRHDRNGDERRSIRPADQRGVSHASLSEMPQPTAGQFATVCSEMAMGKPPENAIEGVYLRTQVPEYGFFAVTLGVQMKSGGGLAETLQTLADTVRQRVAMAARAKAMAGEVIFSSRALSIAPLDRRRPALRPQSVDDRSSCSRTRPGGSSWRSPPASVVTGTLVMRWMIRRETGAMTSGFVFATLAIATATADVDAGRLRTPPSRVEHAGVQGDDGRARPGDPLQDVTRLALVARRAVSPLLLRRKSLEQLRAIVQSSGFDPHRAAPIWIGVKIVSMILFPIAA